MPPETSIFEKTYHGYLARIGEIDFKAVENVLGVKSGEDTIEVFLFQTSYRVSAGGISDPGGDRPSLDVCVILSRYLLMCPEETPVGGNWVSFRDFKDTGPLTVYFENEVERAVVRLFEGDLEALKAACRGVGGHAPDIEPDYDAVFQFDALPRVQLLLLFNDRDEEFPARCSVLFKSSAEKYLDGECLAILGRLLFTSLQEESGMTDRFINP